VALRASAVRKPETVRSRPAGASQLSNQLQSPCRTLIEMYRQRAHCAHSFWQRSVADSQSLPCMLPCLALAPGLAKGHRPWLAWLHVAAVLAASSVRPQKPSALRRSQLTASKVRAAAALVAASAPSGPPASASPGIISSTLRSSEASPGFVAALVASSRISGSRRMKTRYTTSSWPATGQLLLYASNAAERVH